MQVAMVNSRTGVVLCSVVVVVVAALLQVTVAGSSSVTEPGSDLEAPMITLNETTPSTHRPRERKLATVAVWCISIPNATETDLQNSLDWACGPLVTQGQVNCGPINTDGACFDPNTLAHHCDWAFNAYFQRMNGTAEACNFGGTAQQTTTDPSSGTCIFQASNISSDGNNSVPSPPGVTPAGSPVPPAGSPIFSPSAAPADWQPRYLSRVSTAVILVTYLFT